ncbi:MAG: hypothetical protein M1836_001640 [Candelina mexicana]|nr:MAG: hypothetical protein M1836_001640 [Candelina mexicana]
MTRPSSAVACFSLLHLFLFYAPLATSTVLHKSLEPAQLVKRAPAQIYCPNPLPPHTPPGSSPSDEISLSYPTQFPPTLYDTLDQLCWARFLKKSPDIVVANAGCECNYVEGIGWHPQCFSPPGAPELTHNEAIRTYCVVNCYCWTEDGQEEPPPTQQATDTASGKPRTKPMKYQIVPLIDWDAICGSQGKTAAEEAREGFEALPFNERKVESAYCSLAETGGCCKGEKCTPIGEISGKGVSEVLMGVLGSVGLEGLGSCVASS